MKEIWVFVVAVVVQGKRVVWVQFKADDRYQPLTVMRSSELLAVKTRVLLKMLVAVHM